MLEDYFVKPSTIDRVRACWLAPQIEDYVEWMRTKGYADRNVLTRVPLLCQFANFTRQRGVTNLIGAPSKVEEFVAYWAAQRVLNWKSPETRRKFLSAGNPVRQMLRLALEGCVTVSRPRQPFLLEAKHQDSSSTYVQFAFQVAGETQAGRGGNRVVGLARFQAWTRH